MYSSEVSIQVAHEQYRDRLAEACNERRIRAARAVSTRPSSAASSALLIARIVAALHFRRVAGISHEHGR
jgi:hypothetical protein